MNGIKYKYFIFSSSIFIFFVIFFPILNLIRITLNFDPLKINTSKSIPYSYEILSSDNKTLRKLSRKFDVKYQASAQPFLITGMLVTALAIGHSFLVT